MCEKIDGCIPGRVLTFFYRCFLISLSLQLTKRK